MIVRIVPVKMMRRWANRKWYWPFGPRKMFAVMRGNALFTHPANIHDLIHELHEQGIQTQIDEPSMLPDNVFSLKPRKPKK